MTDQPGRSAPIRRSDAGRHYRRRSRGQRMMLAAGVVVIIVTAVGAVTGIIRSAASADDAVGDTQSAANSTSTGTATSTSDSTTSSTPDCALAVAASPDIADAVDTIAAQLPECQIAVTAVDSAAFSSQWEAAGGGTFDVWIPNASVWLTWALGSGVPVPASSPSVATSPVVLALAAPTAQRLSAAAPVTLNSVLQTRLTATPVRIGLPAPRDSAEAIGGLLAMQSAVADQPDARAALTWGLRSTPADLPTSGQDLMARMDNDPGTAFLVSEQALAMHNKQAGTAAAVAVYPSSGGTDLDYPFVDLGSASASADELLRALLEPPGKVAIQEAGFRDPAGVAGASLSTVPGIQPQSAAPAAWPDAATVDDVIHDYELSNEPARSLAILDVSGSMQAEVPDSGGMTRIDLAKDAAKRGLGLYPPDSELGLWEFSTELNGADDYRELVPVGPVGPRSDGVTGQQKLEDALDATEAIYGGDTGLYDTTLQAFRTIQANWDPNRVNTVLILSDGMNDDANSISLPDLLTTLESEQDPQRPVAVISIAFGPDSDVSALTQISTATDGSTYVSFDPNDIGEIFLDAVGQRVCRPDCGA